jgi:broad specificity phosphatase PhoE
MSRLVLVRHGHAAAGWDADPDPGLDDTGRGQAAEMAEGLAGIGPLPLVSSPLRRARETAAALEERWGVEAVVVPEVGEIPSPTDDLAERGAWLREVMRGTWSDVPTEFRSWRDRVLSALTAFDADAVIVTHFIAICAAVGSATGDDRVMTFVPDNCSCTVLEVVDGGLQVVELGHQVVRTEVR